MIVCQTMALKCQSEASDALSLVGLPQLMRLTSGAEAVKIALIDGPVALDHADLARETIHLLPGQPDAKRKIQNSVACVHGTQVAGVLHARRSAAAPGICPTCTLLIRPIFSAEAIETDSRSPLSANPQDAAAAIREAVAAKARIINLSVSLARPTARAEPLVEEALNHAAREGTIVVAASGNQGMLGSSAITRHPWVIPVVATDGRGHVLSLSNLGASIGRRGLAAPGHHITSLAAAGGLSTFSGTSAAAPFVTGSIALLWSLFPRRDATELRVAILGGHTSRHSVAPPLLDARAAYQALTATTIKRRSS